MIFSLLLAGLLSLNTFINNLTLEERVGELFLMGFQGTEYNDEIQQLVDHKIRGFIIYERNVINGEQIKSLISSIRKRCDDIPPIIAVDQEGTLISRIKDAFIPPNAMALGSVNDTRITFEEGYLTGVSLRKLGINMDFAPILDVNTNPNNPVIGIRSFWKDTKRVTEHGISFFKGLLSAGIIPVGKHFPGHGDTSVDSHLELPVVDEKLEEYINKHVTPFKAAIREGIPAIMTAHIVIPSWDNKPATISKKIIGYLRKNLNFDGVVISDDLLMKSISKNMPIGEVIKEALLAGVDMFIIWKDLKKQMEAVDYVIQKVRDGKIPEDVINKAVERVIKLKLLMYTLKNANLDVSLNVNAVPRKAIALCKGDFKFEKGKKYLIFYPRIRDTSFAQSTYNLKELIKNTLRQRGINFRMYYYRYPSLSYRYKNLDKYDAILFFSLNTHMNPSISKMIDTIVEGNPNLVLVAIQSPYDYLFIDKARKIKTYIVTYDWNEDFVKALLSHLIDGVSIEGECILRTAN